MKDSSGEAVACNCLGVNYMLLASPVSDAGTLLGMRSDAQDQVGLGWMNEGASFCRVVLIT